MIKKLTAFLTAAAVSVAVYAPACAADKVYMSDFSESTAAVSNTAAQAEDTPKEINTSIEYRAYNQIAGYIAEKYLDDSYTADDIMKIGLSAYLNENGDEALVALLKAALQSLDEYSDFYTRSEYIEYTNALNKTFYG